VNVTQAMPAELRKLLHDLFGPAIDDVKIVEYSWINALHNWPLAVTRRQRIYLRLSAEEFFAHPELVVHEYFHVLKQWNTGRLTLWRYFINTLKYGYWNNPFEVEAREFAACNCRFAKPGGPQPRTLSL
jgi:hypothetical protein